MAVDEFTQSNSTRPNIGLVKLRHNEVGILPGKKNNVVVKVDFSRYAFLTPSSHQCSYMYCGTYCGT